MFPQGQSYCGCCSFFKENVHRMWSCQVKRGFTSTHPKTGFTTFHFSLWTLQIQKTSSDCSFCYLREAVLQIYRLFGTKKACKKCDIRAALCFVLKAVWNCLGYCLESRVLKLHYNICTGKLKEKECQVFVHYSSQNIISLSYSQDRFTVIHLTPGSHSVFETVWYRPYLTMQCMQ